MELIFDVVRFVMLFRSRMVKIRWKVNTWRISESSFENFSEILRRFYGDEAPESSSVKTCAIHVQDGNSIEYIFLWN